MTHFSKFVLPALLLAFLTSCSPSAATPVHQTATAEPTLESVDQERVPETHQLTPDTVTPEPVVPTPEGEEMECQERGGRLVAYQVPWVEGKLTGQIYTPPCYDQSEMRYPTLYLLHGAAETEQQWEELGLDKVVDDQIHEEAIPPLIIIMPREDTWVSLQENPFGDHLMQTLIPWVDQEYRTLPERRYRAVGGISRGGNWAIRLGMLHWETFGSLGAHSAPLFYGDLNRLPGWLEDIPENSIPRIYLDISEGDRYLPEAESLRDILRDADVTLEWHLYPGLHNETYWSSHLEEYLLWYSAGWSGQ
mgnify:CR=1 FL=1